MTCGSRSMLSRLAAVAGIVGLAAAAAITAPAALAAPTGLSPYDSVDMWTGTYWDTTQNKANSAYGNTWPGATVPFGMVQFTPSTYNTSTGREPGGYSYVDQQLRGFGMTRLSGTGCENANSAFDLPLLPYTGAVNADGSLQTSPAANIKNYYLNYSHANEQGSPGYYKVGLANGVTAELTASTRTSVGQFTYPSDKSSQTLIFNVTGSNNNTSDPASNAGGQLNADVTIDAATRTISGWSKARTVCNGGLYRIYFSATFDKPFTTYGTWNGAVVTAGSTHTASNAGKDQAGAYLSFDKGAKVTVKTGISYVSVANAALNREAETAGKSFADVRAQARTTWEETLGRVDATGGTNSQRTKFYTALYHSLLHPNIYDDVNGEYRGYGNQTTMSNVIHTVRPGHHEYVTYSAWDSYRGQMQLIALLFPQVGSDMAQSITNMSLETGHWYNWPHLGSGQMKMQGDAMQSILSSLYAFGSTDFDAAGALQSMIDTQWPGTTFDASREKMPLYYATVGFIEDRTDKSASTTLDYAQADFGIAQLAQRLGNTDAYAKFMTRAQSWQNLVNQNPAAGNPGRIVPRDRKGSWAKYELTRRAWGNDKPDAAASSSDQYDQSTGLQYQWSAPQNLGGLIEKLGGKAEAEAMLDAMLVKLDDSGSNSQYAYMSNQPSMHVPWIYNWLGKPAKATDVLDRVANEMFHAGVGGDGTPGMPGNDDLGSLSAWYVWTNLGLFPEIFGRAELVVSSPMFEHVTISSQGSTRSIDINAPGSTTKRYITGLQVNGVPQTKSWLPESFTQNGGTLNFTMATTPNSWGTAIADVPPSFTDGTNGFNGMGTAMPGAKNSGSLEFSGNALNRASLGANGAAPGDRLSFGGITYTWPHAQPGEFDHWIPHGQRIDMHGVKASQLSFLGLATNGPSSGHAKVVYTDGTTSASFEIRLSDWTPGTGTTLEPGNVARIVTSGRVAVSTGSLDSSTPNVFSTAPFAVNASKHIAAVILPADVATGIMHIFSVGTNGTEPSVTTGTEPVVAGSDYTVVGNGYPANTAVDVTIGSDPVLTQTVNTNGSGSFTATFDVPADLPNGTYEVRISVRTVETFTVSGGTVTVKTPRITAPGSVWVGDAVTIEGSSFAPHEGVSIALGAEHVTVTANAAGAFTAVVAAPATAGTYTISAFGAVSQIAAAATITVTGIGDEPGTGTAHVTLSTPTFSRAQAPYNPKNPVTVSTVVTGTRTGTVSFVSGTQFIGTAPVVVSGSMATATLTLPKLRPGARVLIATIPASGTSAAAVSPASATFKVKKATLAQLKVAGKKSFRAAKKFTVTVKMSKKLSNDRKVTGKVKVFVGKKVAKTLKPKAVKSGRAKITVAKKYAKGKKFRVRIVYQPKNASLTKVKKSKKAVFKRR